MHLFCTTFAPKLQTFMEAQRLRLFSLFKYHIIAQSVQALIRVCIAYQGTLKKPNSHAKMHQRGNVKTGNMGIGKSFIGSMHEGNIGHLNDPYYPH